MSLVVFMKVVNPRFPVLLTGRHMMSRHLSVVFFPVLHPFSFQGLEVKNEEDDSWLTFTIRSNEWTPCLLVVFHVTAWRILVLTPARTIQPLAHLLT